MIGKPMSIPDAAKALGIGRNSLREHLRNNPSDEQGPLVHMTPGGGRWFVYPEDLERIRRSLPTLKPRRRAFQSVPAPRSEEQVFESLKRLLSKKRSPRGRRKGKTT